MAATGAPSCRLPASRSPPPAGCSSGSGPAAGTTRMYPLANRPPASSTRSRNTRWAWASTSVRSAASGTGGTSSLVRRTLPDDPPLLLMRPWRAPTPPMTDLHPRASSRAGRAGSNRAWVPGRWQHPDPPGHAVARVGLVGQVGLVAVGVATDPGREQVEGGALGVSQRVELTGRHGQHHRRLGPALARACGR